MIDDPELRALFLAENEERLHEIEECLHIIEKNPTQFQNWEELMRDVHTIKASARMLKIQSIEVIAHQYEDILTKIQKGEISFTRSLIKFFYEILDVIRSFVIEEVEGIPSKVDFAKILDEIHALKAGKEVKPKQPIIPSAAPQVMVQPVVTPTSVPPVVPPTPEIVVKKKPKLVKAAKVSKEGAQIATIRVYVNQVNALMTHAAELSIVRNRMERLFEEIEELLSYWEEKKTFQKYSLEISKEKINESEKEIEEKLTHIRGHAYEHIHKLDLLSSTLVDNIRKLSLVPISKLFDPFPSMVREISKNFGKEIDLEIQTEEIGVDRKVIEELKDPLIHVLRNAVAHGIESSEEREQKGKPTKGTIALKAKQTEELILIEVSDDGAGLDLEKIKNKALQLKLFSQEELDTMSEELIQSLIFLPGFTTTTEVSEISGRGVGLDVVQESVENLHGNIRVKSQLGKGCTFMIELPSGYVTTQVMLVRQQSQTYAIPISLIESCFLITFDQISTIEEQDIIYLESQPYPILNLRDLFFQAKKEQAPQLSSDVHYPCLVIKSLEKKFFLLVDAILEEQKLVVVSPSRLFLNAKGILGATILKSGEVCLVINPFDLMKTADTRFQSFKVAAKEQRQRKQKKTILIVDDSLTSREILKRILEGEGYSVVAVEDGSLALDKMNQVKVDAVITDVDMPKMDGITLTSQIRLQYYDRSIPIIMFTSLSAMEDQKRGMDAGANAYIVKSVYNQANLIKKLKELLGL